MKSKIDLIEIDALMTGFWLTDFSNLSAYLFENLDDVNWVGFYLSDGQKLRLGPFCGKPACTEIAFKNGVCGQAFTNKTSVIVDNVDQFPGHIRCDSNSKSEIVIPIFISEQIIGVLDVDSPKFDRFTFQDKEILEKVIDILSRKISNYTGAGYVFPKQ